MRRNFKVKNKKYVIVNRLTKGYEINEYNPKYDLMLFNTKLNAWTRIASCNTLEEGRRIVKEEEL